jgi:hypothetical protein
MKARRGTGVGQQIASTFWTDILCALDIEANKRALVDIEVKRTVHLLIGPLSIYIGCCFTIVSVCDNETGAKSTKNQQLLQYKLLDRSTRVL